jgi:hypothetical protein
VPENEGKFWHLLPLLAKLEKRRLSRVRLHELSDPVQDAPVLLRQARVTIALEIVRRSTWDDAAARHAAAVISRDAIVVLLLCGRLLGSLGRLRLRLNLGLRLLRLKLSMLGYMVIRMLVVSLRPLARVLLLVCEDVLHLRRQFSRL